jgi:oligopeptide transport system permease protein
VGAFLLRRLFTAVLTLFGALLLMFVLLTVMPGDAVDATQGEKFAGETILANKRAKYGLDDPVPIQFGKYLKNLATGDFGYSFKNDASVNDALKETSSNSLRLLFWGSFTQIGGSLLLGFLAAAKRNSIFDRFSAVFGVAMQALPILVTALLAQVLFGKFMVDRNWGFLNIYDRWPSEWRFGVIPKDNWRAVILPAVIVGLVQMAYLARLLRSSMLEVIRADYIRTALAKGLPRWRVLLKHALRPALIPYVTAAALTLVEIFGVAVQTETLFSIYGIGSKVGESAQIQDTPMVLGLSSVVIIAAVFASTVVDIGYSLLDPRVRSGANEE